MSAHSTGSLLHRRQQPARPNLPALDGSPSKHIARTGIQRSHTIRLEVTRVMNPKNLIKIAMIHFLLHERQIFHSRPTIFFKQSSRKVGAISPFGFKGPSVKTNKATQQVPKFQCPAQNTRGLTGGLVVLRAPKRAAEGAPKPTPTEGREGALIPFWTEPPSTFTKALGAF
mmetsp:Transcript_18808/g.51531  ORF Transcript_18808/g.51531 Transcript_18808/m.51531 type:complete len:171 (-) Transcript_18808:127-639(-)